MQELEQSYLWRGPCETGTFSVDRVDLGIAGIQATKDMLSVSTEEFYTSREWSFGHALDFGFE